MGVDRVYRFLVVTTLDSFLLFHIQLPVWVLFSSYILLHTLVDYQKEPHTA